MSRRGEALLVAAAVAVIYALTRSGNHSETEDSVAFAVRVRDDPFTDLLEGTHLVYLAIGRVLYEAVSTVGLTADPLLALQVFDLLVGSATVGALWLLLRNVGVPRMGAAAASGMVAFSYAFWHNAVEVEVYALSALALVGSLAAAWAATRAPSARSFAVFGLANGVAVLAHVTNVLFAVVAGAAVFLAAREHGNKWASVVRWGAAYAAAGTLVVVPAYAVAAAVNRVGSPSEFWHWFTERTGQAGDFGSVGLSNLPSGMFGSGRALVGGHFALSIRPIREFLTTRFTGKTFSEELFFLAGFPTGLAVVLLVLAGMAAALVAALAAQWLRRPEFDPSTRALAILAAAWLVPYALFILSWDPLNIEFWYAMWLPAAILLTLPVAARTRDGARRVAVVVVPAVAVLFATNLVGSVIPQRDEARDLWRAKASWYRQHVRAGDIVVSNGYLWSAYLRYLLAAEVVDIEDLFREADSDRQAMTHLRQRVESARGRVLVSGEAFHAFADRRIACVDAPRTCAIAAVTRRELEDDCRRLAATEDPPERVWECRPAG